LAINGTILEFADDTKLFNCVGCPRDSACLRNDPFDFIYGANVNINFIQVVTEVCRMVDAF